MSVQNEIERIVTAKQELAKWLASHKVVLNVNASINELVDLLDFASTGGIPATTLVPVTVTAAAGVTLTTTVLPYGTLESALSSTDGRSYRCPENSMLVLYCSCTGGTTAAQAYPTVTVTGDLTAKTIYYTGSNSSTNRPVGIFVVQVGTQGGAVTLNRTISKGTVI